MTKRALVVGINDYRHWHRAGFGDLSFCRSDATAFAQLLVDAFMFSENDITVFEDAEATRQAILDGIQLLLSQSAAGDVVCLFFAGHGDRVPQNGLNTVSPRYYETIVPFDGASMISDWEITRLARNLELNHVNFTIVLDSCHSGGVYNLPNGTRSRSTVWVDRWIETFTTACQTLLPFICLPDPEEIDGNVGSIQPSVNGPVLNIDPRKDFSRVARATLFSACNFNEFAEEHGAVGHGRFTHALLENVNMSNFQISYQDFHQAVRAHVRTATNNRQTPQLRGRAIRLEEDFLAGWTHSI